MGIEVNVGGVWKTVSGIEVNIAGVWKTVSNIETNIAGVWKSVSSALSALFNTNGDDNVRTGATCYVGLQINSSGTEYEYTSTGGTTSIGTWLNSGTTSEVWVEMVLVSGTWNSINAGTGRLATTTTRSWRASRTSLGIKTVRANFKFWDAASGGSLLDETGTITFRAEYG